MSLKEIRDRADARNWTEREKRSATINGYWLTAVSVIILLIATCVAYNTLMS